MRVLKFLLPILFSTALIPPPTTALPTNQRPLLAKTSFVDLQSLLSNRMAAHRSIMTSHLSYIQISLSKATTIVDNSFLNIETLKVALDTGANQDILRALKELAVLVGGFRSTRVKGKEGLFEGMMGRVQAMGEEMNDMEVFMRELLVAIDATIARVPISKEVSESNDLNTAKGHEEVHNTKEKETEGNLMSLREAMLMAFMHRASNPLSPTHLSVDLLPPRPFLHTLHTNFTVTLTANLSFLSSTFLPKNTTNTKNATHYICALIPLHITHTYNPSETIQKIMTYASMPAEACSFDVLGNEDGEWKEEEFINGKGQRMGHFGDGGVEKVKQWWD